METSMSATEMTGLQKERGAGATFSFAKLKEFVYKAEHVTSSYLCPSVYRSLAELDGYGVKPEVEDLLKRAESVLEQEGAFFPDLEETLDALEKGQKPMTWEGVSDLARQAVAHFFVCENRAKNRPDDAECQQALVKAADWRVRAERLMDIVYAKKYDADRSQLAKQEQEVLDSERRGCVLTHETYLAISAKAESGRPDDMALLRRAEAVRERDGLFFRDLEETINALEKGQLELSNDQLLALYLQAECNLSALAFSRDPLDAWSPLRDMAESLNERAKRLFKNGTEHERNLPSTPTL
jgi:hypothetical protein